jgi:hypothetical protein
MDFGAKMIDEIVALIEKGKVYIVREEVTFFSIETSVN